MRLEQSDIQRLIREHSPSVRADITRKVCQGYNAGMYSESETKLAEEIIRLLVRDTSRKVRLALSQELQSHPSVPKEVVLALANDHEDVAESILSYSPRLEEGDLQLIVESTRSLKKLLAISQRECLSSPLVMSLLKTGEHKVTHAVIDNPGAQIDQPAFEYLLEEYYEDDSILEALVYRGGLPHGVAERLFALVSDQMKKQLTRKYRLSRILVEDAVNSAREVSTLRFLSPWMGQNDIQQLVHEMYRHKRLSDSVIIRSLCIGDLRFFRAAMARRSEISLQNADILLSDPGDRGFDACYTAAEMPAEFRDAVRVLFRCAAEETDFGQFHHERFTERVVERIIEQGHNNSIQQMPYLLAILGKNLHEHTSIH